MQCFTPQTLSQIDRHRHKAAYAAIVLEGGYEEAGDHGRFRVTAGDVLVHGPFTSHLNRLASIRTVLINIPLPPLVRIGEIGRVSDPEQIARTALKDRWEALDLFSACYIPSPAKAFNEVDALAAALREDASISIGTWSAMQSLCRETLSRHFHRIYGVTALSYRRDVKSRRAWLRIVESNAPLSEIALECAFADQAHMSRAILALTGHSPTFWRRQRTDQADIRIRSA
jgi:AraC-like DNA-binding protein